MKKILIIEDDRALGEGIALGLGTNTYEFIRCETLKEAEEAWEKEAFDLVILDLNLPDGSGYDFLRTCRSQSDIPVLMLTANDLEMNEVIGFELGANDRKRGQNCIRKICGNKKVKTKYKRSQAGFIPIKGMYPAYFCMKVRKLFELTGEQITDVLRLTRPIFRQTAAFGHFERKESPCRRIDKVEALRKFTLRFEEY